ncbi:uncharacterized mitochondrial protein-like protein [Tanacetum coccineum]
MSVRDKTDLGYGTQLNEMSNDSETDSEISLSVFDVRSSDEESTPANDRSSKADGYHAILPPITGNFLTPRADISFAVYESVNKDKVIIEDWNSDDEDDVSEVQTVSLTDHLIKDYNFHDKKSQETKLKNVANTVPRVNKPVWDNAKRVLLGMLVRVRPFAPKIAQTSGAIRLIYPRMDNVRPRGSYSPIKRSYYTKLAFKPKDLKQDVKTFGVQNMTTAGTRAVVNTGKGKMDIDLKKSRWVWRPKGNYLDHVSKDSGSFMLKKVEYVDPKGISKSDHAVVDSGYSSHMTGNKAYLSDYEDFNGGFVAFGSDPKGGKITGKGTQDSYVAGSSGKDKGLTQEYILLPLQPHRTRIPVEDVAPAAHEKPSESSPKDNDVQNSKDDVDKKEQHQMKESEQDLQDELEKMVTQELAAKAMDDVSRQALRKENRENCISKKAAQVQMLVNHHLFYLGGKIPIDASTLPNADLPIDPNMPDLEDASDTLPNDGLFNGTYDDDEDDKSRDPTSAVQTRRGASKGFFSTTSLGKEPQDYITAVTMKAGLKQCKRNYFSSNYRRFRLFLAFASYMGFTVYQMDVKSAFLYGTIEEEVYVHQPPGFVDPAHPNKVYKVIKALYGLHQAPRAWYETLSSFLIENGFRRVDILKKFDFLSIRIATTPIESNKPLVKDEDGVDVDVHVYRSMIGSLMYLTASRPDIMFAVCACARFQVTPKASHLNAVKRIFRYLKHQPKLGLWYPRDSPFELEAYSDSDYGGASLDRKSTTGGCQFLGRRLISWQCKKQTIVAILLLRQNCSAC